MPETLKRKQAIPHDALFSASISGDPAKIDKDMDRFRKGLEAYNKKNGTKFYFPHEALAKALRNGGDISTHGCEIFRIELGKNGRQASLFYKGKDDRKEFSLDDPVANAKLDVRAVRGSMAKLGPGETTLILGKDGKCYLAANSKTEFGAAAHTVLLKEVEPKKASLFRNGEFPLDDPSASIKLDRQAVINNMKTMGPGKSMLFFGKDGKCYLATNDMTESGAQAYTVSLKEVPRPKPNDEALSNFKNEFLGRPAINVPGPYQKLAGAAARYAAGSLFESPDYRILASPEEFVWVPGSQIILHFPNGGTLIVTCSIANKQTSIEVPKNEQTDKLWEDAFALHDIWDIYEEYKGKPKGPGTGYPAERVKELVELKESVSIRLSKLIGESGLGKPDDIKKMTVEYENGYAFNSEFIGTAYFDFWKGKKEKPAEEEPIKDERGKQVGALPAFIHPPLEISRGTKTGGSIEYPEFAVEGRPVPIFIGSGKAASSPVFVIDAQDNEVFSGIPGPGGRVSFVPRGTGELKYSLLTSEGKMDFTLKVGVVKIKIPKEAVSTGAQAGIKIAFDFGGKERNLQAPIRLVRDGEDLGVFSADDSGTYSFPAGKKGTATYEVFASSGGQPIGSFRLSVH